MNEFHSLTLHIAYLNEKFVHANKWETSSILVEFSSFNMSYGWSRMRSECYGSWVWAGAAVTSERWKVSTKKSVKSWKVGWRRTRFCLLIIQQEWVTQWRSRVDF